MIKMKKAGIVILSLILISLAWMGFVREPLPDVPSICAELSEEKTFDFTINQMDMSGVELSLNNKVKGKGMFVQFKMGNAWKTGRPGLVVAGMGSKSEFRNGMSPKAYLDNPGRKGNKGKDFSDFMKDNKGKPVNVYSFSQTLTEADDGKKYMRMSYDGPPMEMLQILEISRPITVPGHISSEFVSKGVLQFLPGTYAFDKSINGFYLEVKTK